MDLICYRHEGWDPQIRPAEATRAWMDASPEAFAYRCLPLNIANAHGWEILSPCSFEARWTGGGSVDDVLIRVAPDVPHEVRPVSLFGQATITFHIQGLFRTPPGWNLWVGGSPNRAKEGIAPLTGVIETDWSPYTFTMNWRFLRRNHLVRFEAGEPICFVFPLLRDALESFQPKFVPLADAPEVGAQFEAWSQSRNAFQEVVRRKPPQAPADKWQKRYYRGIDMRDRTPVPDHRSKLRLKPFVEAAPEQDDRVRVEIAPERFASAVATLVDGDVDTGVRGLIAAGLPDAVACLLSKR
ncbi:MAG: hypothetical protein JOZ17_19130, partial [Acetobacteraceae bacterium]|nr:hypothetical protein [Acetobacteraceae bacterium]